MTRARWHGGRGCGREGAHVRYLTRDFTESWIQRYERGLFPRGGSAGGMHLSLRGAFKPLAWISRSPAKYSCHPHRATFSIRRYGGGGTTTQGRLQPDLVLGLMSWSQTRL